MWHSRPPRDPPPPLHGKCHSKFPFSNPDLKQTEYKTFILVYINVTISQTEKEDFENAALSQFKDIPGGVTDEVKRI